MIRSMTGFGGSKLRTKLGFFTAEIRTLNHKFLEITPKLSNSLAIFDEKAKAIIKNKVKRGKVYFNLTHDTTQETGANIFIDYKLAKSYCGKLKNLKKQLNVEGSVQMSDIISFPGVINYRLVEKDAGRLWPLAQTVINQALAKLIKDREREGSFLLKDLMMRLRKIKKILSSISKDA